MHWRFHCDRTTDCALFLKKTTLPMRNCLVLQNKNGFSYFLLMYTSYTITDSLERSFKYSRLLFIYEMITMVQVCFCFFPCLLCIIHHICFQVRKALSFIVIHILILNARFIFRSVIYSLWFCKFER